MNAISPGEQLAEMVKLTAQLTDDIEAYRAALGYPVRRGASERLHNGEIPQCGLCNSEFTKNAKEFYEKYQSNSSLEAWFPITAERIEQLETIVALQQKQIERLIDARDAEYQRGREDCMRWVRLECRRLTENMLRFSNFIDPGWLDAPKTFANQQKV